MDNPITVTVDTNQFDREKLAAINRVTTGLDIQLAKTTVTNRESGVQIDNPEDLMETAVWDESLWGRATWGGPLTETLVIGESAIGLSTIGDTDELFEALLQIIGNGSFPPKGKRDNLSVGQRRQMRDVMILATHVREGRSIFLSDDVKAFGKPGSSLRAKLEELCNTRIMTSTEFTAYCVDLRSKKPTP